MGRALGVFAWVWAALLAGEGGAAAQEACADVRLELAVRTGQDWKSVGELRLLPEGRRTMRRTERVYRRGGPALRASVEYSVVPTGEREERFFLARQGSAATPVVSVEFDRRDRPGREVVRRMPFADESTLMENSRTLEWFEYTRDSSGRLVGLTMYGGAGSDAKWLTGDDEVVARVSIDYGAGRTPTEATVTTASVTPWGGRLEWKRMERVHFSYDREGAWSGVISDGGKRAEVLSGRCLVVPERVVVLLLSPISGSFDATSSLESLR